MRTATDEEIRSGRTTDIYFEHTREVLQALGVHKQVTASITASSFPDGYDWAMLSGVYDALSVLDGLPVDVEVMEEGTIFYPGEPVMQITGDYLCFGVLETALLGYLCNGSGIATKAARCKKAAGDRAVISFGARRMHPAIAPFIERNAYIGGCDGVSTVLAAELLGIAPSGTMPHALIIVLGGVEEAVKRFDEVVDPEVPRVALVDTFCDEKMESIAAAKVLGEKLKGVRLDTPGSRRGNMAKIVEEVRWELDLRGYQHVKIFVSGGINETQILRLNTNVDAYGVGTAISGARTIDLALDIVEIEGRPLAKRGKKAGRKQIIRCEECFDRLLAPYGCSDCALPCASQGHQAREMLVPAIKNGERVMLEKTPVDIRDYVLEQLECVDLRIT